MTYLHHVKALRYLYISSVPVPELRQIVVSCVCACVCSHAGLIVRAPLLLVRMQVLECMPSFLSFSNERFLFVWFTYYVY